jgi:peptidoglycan/LPS O-acetylase OafA/YrhL
VTIAKEVAEKGGPGSFYLPSLDCLRFFAFFCVFVMHTTENDLGGNSAALNQIYGGLHAALGYGVSVFFCLSAFLITTLLLREKEGTGRVLVPQFYFRRILRIWPVYYLVLILGAVILPPFALVEPSGEWFWRFASFTGNYSMEPSHTPMIAIAPLWSVCVEEQFYLVWPWVVGKLSRDWMRRVCLVLLVVSPLIRAFTAIGGATEYDMWFKTWCHMDCFAAGALVALYWKRELGIKIGRNTAWLLPLCVAVLGLQSIFAPFAAFTDHILNPLQAASYSVVALASALLVWTVSLMHAPKLKWLRRPLVLGGKLSYSLYCFHGSALMIAPAYIGAWTWIAGFLGRLIPTFLVSCVSYFGYEQWFLKLKDRFQVVMSGA